MKPVWVFVHYIDRDKLFYNEENIYLTKKEAKEAFTDFKWAVEFAGLSSEDMGVVKCVKSAKGLETTGGHPLTPFKEEYDL